MSREPLSPAKPSPDASTQASSWPLRVVWFFGLWLGSVSLLGVVALLIRFWLNP